MTIVGQLWLDGLYVRLTSPREAEFSQFLSTVSNAQLWMTGVTLQGNGDGQRDCFNCGVEASSAAPVYAAGVINSPAYMHGL